MSKILITDAIKNFQKTKTGSFKQIKPKLSLPHQSDIFARQLIRQKVSDSSAVSKINADLDKFSHRLVDQVHALGHENELFPPRHRAYDPWGNRIDQLTLSPAWGQLKNVSAEEGLIALGYERQFGKFNRIHQFAKLSYFHPHSGMFSCPLAMTDGAAHVLETMGKTEATHCFDAFGHLTSRDPNYFWTSGQWMTEKRGGSDVGHATDTICHENKLYGYKWFTSATDSEMCLTLARNADEHGHLIPGTQGLTMYFIKTQDPTTENGLNGVQIMQLKDKLGTKGLPTAELLLSGTKATQLGETGRGVPSIANMLHLTRLHNAAAAVGAMRQAMLMSREFSQHRFAFGSYIKDFTLHVQNLARMETETRAGTAFFLRVAELFGQYEVEKDEKAYLLMRSLTPLLKLYTGKQAVAVCSEALEVFGGSGYMEDSEMPVLLRDSQVLPIWEGTSNVMSLDVLRSIFKSKGQALKIILEDCVVLSKNDPDILNQVLHLKKFAEKGYLDQTSSRDFSMWLSEVYMCSLLIHAAENEVDFHAVEIWKDLKFRKDSKVFKDKYSQTSTNLDQQLVFE